MMLKREGRFKSRIETAVINKTKANDLCQVVMQHLLTDELIDGDWEDIRSENTTIRSYTVVQTKDGELNDAVLERLQQAFPDWDRKTWKFWDIENGPLACQITVEKDDYYNDPTAMKVQWINNINDEGVYGMVSAPEAVSELDKLSGGTDDNDVEEPATAVKDAPPEPKKPSKHTESSPTMAKAKAQAEEVFGKSSAQSDPVNAIQKPAVEEALAVDSPAPPTTAPPDDVWDMQRAWDSLLAFFPNVDHEEMENRWHARIKQIGKDAANFTSDDWKVMGAQEAILPFG